MMAVKILEYSVDSEEKGQKKKNQPVDSSTKEAGLLQVNGYAIV